GLPVPGVGGIATDSIASSSSSPKSSMTRRLWKPTLLDLRNCRPTCCPSLRHGERSYADRLIHRPNGASLDELRKKNQEANTRLRARQSLSRGSGGPTQADRSWSRAAQLRQSENRHAAKLKLSQASHVRRLEQEHVLFRTE